MLPPTIGIQITRGLTAVTVSIVAGITSVSIAPFVFAGYCVAKGVAVDKTSK